MLELAKPVDNIERLEAALMHLPSVKDQCQLFHHFGPGVYVRELRRPKDTFIIGHAHKTQHLNILVKGRLSVYMQGKVMQVVAPKIFISEAGVRKITYSHEESTLVTIHPTNETDIEKLEDELITKSESFLRNELDEARKLILQESAIAEVPA